MKKHQTQMIAAATACVGIFLGAEASAAPSGTPAGKDQELAFAGELFNHRNATRAFTLFRKYAAAGDPAATAWLGRCYLEGVGTGKDLEMAYRCFASAAEKNDPQGINYLGICHQYGYGTPRDLRAAEALFERAAALNHPQGTLNLAMAYADKADGDGDDRKAELHFKKAIELGESTAKLRYAEFLFARRRYAEAFPLLREFADQPSAMYLLAQCYQNGLGVRVDIAKAVELAERHYREAGAAKWSAEICYDAGFERFVANGMIKDEQVKRRIECAARQGHPRAQYEYARILAADLDRDGALDYTIKAADGDFLPAIFAAGEMLVESGDIPRAVKYFMLAATSADPEIRRKAVEQLSAIYHRAPGSARMSALWDTLGMELGSDACRNQIALNELHADGDRHFARAAALFAEGARNGNVAAGEQMDEILIGNYERLRALADKGSSDARFALGIVGCMEKPNVAIGMELLETAGEHNHAAACRVLGDIYRQGVLVPADLRAALAWYQSGAIHGDPESAKQAALMVFRHFPKMDLKDVRDNFEKALKLEVYSVAYEYGRIMEQRGKDPKKAVELYRLAAKYDDTRAMYRLYELLAETDRAEALAMLRRAAKLDHAAAELKLGDLCRAESSPRQAFIHYLRAFSCGDKVDAPCKLAECWLNGIGCNVNHSLFWKYAGMARKNGSAEVCHLLGTVYREGKICPRDPEKAKACFEEGAKRGSARCKDALKTR